MEMNRTSQLAHRLGNCEYYCLKPVSFRMVNYVALLWQQLTATGPLTPNYQ